MKKFFLLLTLLAAALAIYPFLNPDRQAQQLTGLPWQIDRLEDGSTRVFGVHVGHSTLAEVIETLGRDMQLAIVAASGEEGGSLEMYYGHYKAGLLGGKLVLQANASAEAIRRWRENSPKSEYMATGKAKKYLVDEKDLNEVLAARVSGISFIPAVNLDEEIILQRFGQPAQILQGQGVRHFLYPQTGLHIALSENEKEVLQYVAPQAFARWVAPLLVDGVKQGRGEDGQAR